MDGVAATPTPHPAPVRWGILDAALAWFLSLAAAAIATAPFVEHGRIPRADEAVTSVVLQKMLPKECQEAYQRPLAQAELLSQLRSGLAP
jgi:hypothetical protein